MRIKNIKVPVSRHVIDAAFMAGLPVSLYVNRAVNSAAQDTLDSANRVLLEAGIRDKTYQDMQRERRGLRELAAARKLRNELHSKLADHGHNGGPAIKVKRTPKYDSAGDLIGFDKEVHHYVSPPLPESNGEVSGRIRGLIADYKGDFFSKYGRKTTLRDVRVWQCHRDVHGCGTTADTSDHTLWAQVIVAMMAAETSND